MLTRIKIFVLLMFLCNLSLNAQKNEINKFIIGIILDADNNLPVSNLTVFTEFTQTTTDDLGRYILSLSNCDCNVGDVLRIFTINDEYGWSETRYTITNTSKQFFDFKLFANPNSFYVNGIVKDEKDKSPLGGIEIKILLKKSNEEIKSQTLADGTFQIPISKKLLGSDKTVRMIVSDPNKSYLQNDNLQEILSFIKIELRKQNDYYDPKKEIGLLGLGWNYHDFAQAIVDKQIDVVELYAKGGMKLMKNDFINYFTKYYDEKITQVLIDNHSIESDICPLEYMVDIDFYYQVQKKSNLSRQLSEICNSSENYQKIENLISTEQAKITSFSSMVNNTVLESECVKDFELNSNYNSDDIFYKLYDAASRLDIFSSKTYSSSKSRVLAELYSFLLIEGAGEKDESINFLRNVIKQECPELYILIEADDYYLKKILCAKSIIFPR